MFLKYLKVIYFLAFYLIHIKSKRRASVNLFSSSVLKFGYKKYNLNFSFVVVSFVNNEDIAPNNISKIWHFLPEVVRHGAGTVTAVHWLAIAASGLAQSIRIHRHAACWKNLLLEKGTRAVNRLRNAKLIIKVERDTSKAAARVVAALADFVNRFASGALQAAKNAKQSTFWHLCEFSMRREWIIFKCLRRVTTAWNLNEFWH